MNDESTSNTPDTHAPTGTIYGWRFKATGEIRYVGKTWDVDRRKAQHIRAYGGCRRLYNAFKKYGADAFEFVMLQNGIDDPLWLLLAEGQWARNLGTLQAMNKRGYNLIDPWGEAEMMSEETRAKIAAGARRNAADPEWRAKVAEASRRRAADPEWRAKQAEANRRTAADPEWRAKMADVARRNAADPEWRAKVAEASRRRAADPEWRANRAEASRRTAADPEWRAKMADVARRNAASTEWRAKNAEAARRRAASTEWRAKNAEAMRLLAADPEWRAKVAEAMRLLAADPEWRAKVAEASRRRAIPVFCIETGTIYDSARAAGRLTSIAQSSITHACRGRNKTAGGYHWRYATPKEAAQIKAPAL